MAEKERILEILELENDEEFKIKSYNPTFRIHNGKREYKDGNIWRQCASEEFLAYIINNPSLIQRKPRFNDEEMTVLRWLHKYAHLRHIDRDPITGEPYADIGGLYGIEGNIATYLLKPGGTIDLDTLFKEDE